MNRSRGQRDCLRLTPTQLPMQYRVQAIKIENDDASFGLLQRYAGHETYLNWPIFTMSYGNGRCSFGSRTSRASVWPGSALAQAGKWTERSFGLGDRICAMSFSGTLGRSS